MALVALVVRAVFYVASCNLNHCLLHYGSLFRPTPFAPQKFSHIHLNNQAGSARPLRDKSSLMHGSCNWNHLRLRFSGHGVPRRTAGMGGKETSCRQFFEVVHVEGEVVGSFEKSRMETRSRREDGDKVAQFCGEKACCLRVGGYGNVAARPAGEFSGRPCQGHITMMLTGWHQGPGPSGPSVLILKKYRFAGSRSCRIILLQLM